MFWEWSSTYLFIFNFYTICHVNISIRLSGVTKLLGAVNNQRPKIRNLWDHTEVTPRWFARSLLLIQTHFFPPALGLQVLLRPPSTDRFGADPLWLWHVLAFEGNRGWVFFFFTMAFYGPKEIYECFFGEANEGAFMSPTSGTAEGRSVWGRSQVSVYWTVKKKKKKTRINPFYAAH